MKNNNLLSNDYTTFNSSILLAAQAKAIKEIIKNKGWFHHSELTLLPAIQHRDQILHHIRSKDPSEDNTAIKVELRAAENVFSDHFSLAQAAVYIQQATIIHNM